MADLSFDPWTLVVDRLIDKILETMDPLAVARKCNARNYITALFLDDINRMAKAGVSERVMTNQTLMGKLHGTDIDCYKGFKEILKEIGDEQHKTLLAEINKKEEEVLTTDQLFVIRGVNFK